MAKAAVPPPVPANKPVIARAQSAPVERPSSVSTAHVSPTTSPVTSPGLKPKTTLAQVAAQAKAAGASTSPAVADVKKVIKKRPSSGSGGLSFAKAIADYTPSAATQNEDLAFRKGDEILVLHKYKDGWWKGSLNGAQGLFPSTFVQLIDIRETKGITDAAKQSMLPNKQPAPPSDADLDQL